MELEEYLKTYSIKLAVQLDEFLVFERNYNPEGYTERLRPTGKLEEILKDKAKGYRERVERS